MVCHSLLQWTAFCQTSPPWLVCLRWPHMAWLSFIELDKAVVHVIRLASCLWLWFQCVCPLIPSLSAYCLTWVSLTLDVGYLFMAASAKCSRCSWPWTWGPWMDGSSCAGAAATPAAATPAAAQPPLLLQHTVSKHSVNTSSLWILFFLWSHS